MHTTLTPACLHEARFCSLKKPRSEPYSCGARPKDCLWRWRENATWTSSGGLPLSTSYCVIRPAALSARKTLWPNSTGVRTLPRLIRVGMRLEDGIDLLVGSELLTKEHTTTCLIDDTISQVAEVLDLPAQFLDGHVGEHVLAAHRAGSLEPRACVSYDLLGAVDEHSVCAGQLPVTLSRRHALDLVHSPPRRTCTIAKPLNSLQFQRFCQTADQPGHDADHIP